MFFTLVHVPVQVIQDFTKNIFFYMRVPAPVPMTITPNPNQELYNINRSWRQAYLIEYPSLLITSYPASYVRYPGGCPYWYRYQILKKAGLSGASRFNTGTYYYHFHFNCTCAAKYPDESMRSDSKWEDRAFRNYKCSVKKCRNEVRVPALNCRSKLYKENYWFFKSDSCS